jgi:hypothetical protein
MRAGTPGRNEGSMKAQPEILAFLPDWDCLSPHAMMVLAGLEEIYPLYKFDPERNPNSAKRYGVRIWPTFIVKENENCSWRTHYLSVLLDGLGIEVDLL